MSGPDPKEKPSDDHSTSKDLFAESFGDYELERELGRGGMGVVFLARQIELNRPVAIKMLSGHYGPRELHRFLAEAETAAALHHNNIADIYEVGEHLGAPFYSMEFLPAGSLADRLRGELPSARETAQLLIPVARALHFAHQNGVVHRDMKPANILLDSEGIPKITDFGIAKRLDDESKLTRTGDVIGTPTYMAPEQAKGGSRHVGPAADIYAMGAILYEMLTGRPPFLPEDSETAITVRVLTEDPVSPAWHRPGIPRELETICMKCLEKEPRHRYTTAAEVAEDLRRFLDDESILAKPPNKFVRSVKWARRHPWTFISATVLAVALVLAFVWLGNWILYRRLRTEYAATLKHISGRVEVDTPLTADRAQRVEISYRLTREGWLGPITRVEVVNSHGNPAAVRDIYNYDALPNWFEGLAGMQKQEERSRESTAVEFAYANGQVSEASAVDRNGNVVWRIIYDYGNGGGQTFQARFINLRGYEIGSASHAEFERDAAGRDARVRFFSSSGQPKPNGEGVYGYNMEFDPSGHVTRLINLGADGRPALNSSGVGGFVVTYNPRGQISRSDYLGADEKPSLLNGVAAISDEYDDEGNLRSLSSLDAGGRLTNSTGGVAKVDYKRDDKGETTEIRQNQLKPDGSFETVAQMNIDYDGNGYPSDVRTTGKTTERRQFNHDQVGNITEERYLDSSGKLAAGPNGWSIRRKTYAKTTNPPGWREEETYFDANGGKAYHSSGHHRTIVEYDQAGQLRRFVNEDHDPKRFSYYRYVSLPEFYVGGKLRRLVSRFETEDGQLASKAGLGWTSVETYFDEDGREVTAWQLGCDIETLGAPVIRVDNEWHGKTRKRIIQACDENRKPVAYISTGTPAHIEQEYDDKDGLEHIFETGFDEKLVGFFSREARFANGLLQSIEHKRSDGSIVTAVNVYIKSVSPAQPKSAELRTGDQIVAANGKPVVTAYAWEAGKFPGGSLEVLRNGQRIRIDGFTAGALGVILEERAPSK